MYKCSGYRLHIDWSGVYKCETHNKKKYIYEYDIYSIYLACIVADNYNWQIFRYILYENYTGIKY